MVLELVFSEGAVDGNMNAPRSVPNHPHGLFGLGPELRRAEVYFDRNYDNYDECELRYRNFDNAISIGFKNTGALC